MDVQSLSAIKKANTQALQLDTMQGLADLYALQTEGGV